MFFDSENRNNRLIGAKIVDSATNLTLLGGGELDPADLALALDLAPYLVAADGGADAALSSGVIPDAVIGDLDSLSKDAMTRLDPATVHHLADQNTTDFDKCLRSISAPCVLAVGFMGARVDHELAVFNVLARRPGPCILIGPRDIIFAAPAELELSLEPNNRLSLFPMAPVTGTSKGLRWNIDGIAFAPDGMVSTSNRTKQAEISLRFDGPGMLVILPKRFLEPAMAALMAFWLPPGAASV